MNGTKPHLRKLSGIMSDSCGKFPATQRRTLTDIDEMRTAVCCQGEVVTTLSTIGMTIVRVGR